MTTSSSQGISYGTERDFFPSCRERVLGLESRDRMGPLPVYHRTLLSCQPADPFKERSILVSDLVAALVREGRCCCHVLTAAVSSARTLFHTGRNLSPQHQSSPCSPNRAAELQLQMRPWCCVVPKQGGFRWYLALSGDDSKQHILQAAHRITKQTRWNHEAKVESK